VTSRPRGCLLALFALSVPLQAATLDARSIAYIPSRYSPGEEVFAQAILIPEGNEKPAAFDLRPGAGLAAQGEESDPEIRELRLSRTAAGWLLSLRFVPWSPGALAVPASRQNGIQIPAFPYSAITVLGPEDRDPAAPRRQRDPPGTALFLYGLAGFLLVLALGAFGAAAWLVPAARALLARRRAAQAYRRLITSLEYLSAEATSADPAAFFAALTRAFRLYLAARGILDAPALTAPEFALLPEEALPAPGTKAKAAALFAFADGVRYGAGIPATAAAREVLESAASQARSIAEANEEVLLARL
jgi:hypothetical protein